MSDIRPVFATPTMGGVVTIDFHRSVVETIWAMKDIGMEHAFIARDGDPYLAKVRNKLLTVFLEEYPNATDLFWIDSDEGWPAAKVIELLERPEDVVCGIYPKKCDHLDFPVELCADPETGELIERNGLFMARGVPTGFLRIKRHVIEAMAATSRKFRDMEADGSYREFYNVFEMGAGADGWWWGEDYVWCRKYLDMGGDIWVDPTIPFTHRGGKKWSATLTDHLPTFRAKALAAALAAKKEAAE